jgi:hypothetical protein
LPTISTIPVTVTTTSDVQIQGMWRCPSAAIAWARDTPHSRNEIMMTEDSIMPIDRM